MINFFPVNADEINQDKVELCGSTAMLAAINKNSDVTLIDIRLNIKEGKRIEFITVDICNDEIPSRNVIGINYRERICFVFIEEESLPLTLALRQDFPITMHQNAPSEDSAKSLCLYLEPSDVVEASWTAEKHIKRTNWWLKKTAIEKLHHNDQGVEQLFYNPSLTIVLPFDFDFKSNFGRQLNVISRDRNDTKDGFFIVTDWDENRSLNNSLHLNIVTIKTKPIVHGVINLNVNTLSSLTKLFHSLDVDIVNLIRLQLLDIINTNKCNLYIDFTVFILTLPIKRSSDSEVENTQTVALFSNKSLAELVVLFEVPCQSLNKFRLNFIGGLFPFSCNDIDLSIEFMECLKESCKKSRQLQSGTYKPFGSGAIIGAGSLGGALADLWVKSGWGTWTIIDNDLFRPHNFTRHVISPSFLGKNKAEAVAHYYSSRFKDCDFTGINIDAKKFDDPVVKEYLKNVELVIDASASLSYPRAVSTIKNAPRHIAAFFTPTGNGCVLLAEDSRRKIRLASLEAQYYRVLINEFIGDKHLLNSFDQFRSGVTCRDNSFVMSHSRVMACSSLLSEHIAKISNQSKSAIMIWHEDLDTGERVSFKTEAHKDITKSNHNFDKFKIHWDIGIEKRVRKLRDNNLPNETGGILIGYHDMVQKSVYIVDALPAPIDSVGTPISFLRGTAGVIEELERIAAYTANNVGYIGEWHSHPKGASAQMSQLDIEQLKELAISLSDDGLPAYQMIVAENEIKVYEKVL